ncbi:D-amino acid dehydrogenase [Rhodoferax sp.]|uniref:D-amino acid dehydrogenase n=1 Tax=Rhodoferax sp. TaxID=50421 RepID=UPI00374D165A
MHVCVLGAGIVGLATAYVLRQQGLEVTVVDRATPGAGASGGNGAQLSYSYVQPLADPGIWKQLPKLLLSADSPLKLQPQWDPQQWRWGLAFLRACNTATSADSTAQLLQLAARSRLGFEAMLQDLALDCDFSRTGKLVVYASAEALAGVRRQVALQQALGSVQEVVSAERCVALEPALQHYQAQMAGAVYTPGECAADCLKVCAGLHAALLARGVKFLLGDEVTGVVRQGARLQAVQTRAGPLQADQFVLALGSASAAFARPLGLRLPVYPLKGYSITLDIPGASSTAPTVSVTDAARKVVFARIGSRLRVAGMAELVGQNTAISPERIQQLREATRALFPECNLDGELNPWTGMRPATPTGLPLVGRHARGPENLLLNTGHGALGFTLAFGTAQRLADALLGRGAINRAAAPLPRPVAHTAS